MVHYILNGILSKGIIQGYTVYRLPIARLHDKKVHLERQTFRQNESESLTGACAAVGDG